MKTLMRRGPRPAGRYRPKPGRAAALLLAGMSALAQAQAPPPAYDLVIRNGRVLDGAGNLVIAGGFRNIGVSPRQGLAAVPPPAPPVALPPHIFGNGFEN